MYFVQRNVLLRMASFAYKCGYNYIYFVMRERAIKIFYVVLYVNVPTFQKQLSFWFSPQEENVFIFFFILIGFKCQTNAVRLFNCLSVSRTKVELNVTINMPFCYVCNHRQSKTWTGNAS